MTRHTISQLTDRLRRLTQRGEDGQMLVMASLTFVVVLAFSALAIDVGYFTHTRTKLQADVDAAALAGAQGLCTTAECAAIAEGIAHAMKERNDIRVTDTVTISTTEDCSGHEILRYDKISVRAERRNASFLAHLIGYDGANISACATAGRFAFGGGSGVRPFALEDNCIENITYDTTVVIKYDSDTTRNCDSDSGNYAAVAIDGSGASIYRTTIKYGSNGAVCIEGTDGCCPTLQTGCSGVYKIDTEPGNMIGPTRDGIDYLIDNTPANCDTWEEVTDDDQNVVPACRPWAEGYTGATRVIIIPVVDGLWDKGGRHAVTIKNFAILFLEGYDDKCKGNECDVRARFIPMTATLPNAILGPAGVLSNITVVTLTE